LLVCISKAGSLELSRHHSPRGKTTDLRKLFVASRLKTIPVKLGSVIEVRKGKHERRRVEMSRLERTGDKVSASHDLRRWNKARAFHIDA